VPRKRWQVRGRCHARAACTLVTVTLVCEDCGLVEEWLLPAEVTIGRATCKCGGQLVRPVDGSDPTTAHAAAAES
jgi:hypothetical protein